MIDTLSSRLGVLLAMSLLAACRKEPPPPQDDEAKVALARALEASGLEGGDGGLAAQRQREIDARIEAARRDAGLLEPTDRSACEGASLSLLGAALDPRCAAAERDHARATKSGERGLRQEARADGARIVFALVNTRPAPLAIPVRARSGAPGAAFSVLAEDARGEVFELAPPALDVDADGGARVQTAVLRLAPEGRATATMTIDPRVTSRLTPGRACADAGDGGDCAPPRLPAGRYTLFIGQLLTELDAGPPARVAWDAP